MARYFTWYHIFTFLTLTLKFDLLLKNFNLSYNDLTRRGRVLILHMCILYDNTFYLVPYLMTLWLCPWNFTFFWKSGYYLVWWLPPGEHRCLLTTLIHLVTLTLNFDLLLKTLTSARIWLLCSDSCRLASIVVIWQLLKMHLGQRLECTVVISCCLYFVPSSANRHYHFTFSPLIISVIHGYFQLKFGMQMCH